MSTRLNISSSECKTVLSASLLNSTLGSFHAQDSISYLCLNCKMFKEYALLTCILAFCLAKVKISLIVVEGNSEVVHVQVYK